MALHAATTYPAPDGRTYTSLYPDVRPATTIVPRCGTRPDRDVLYQHAHSYQVWRAACERDPGHEGPHQHGSLRALDRSDRGPLTWEA